MNRDDLIRQSTNIQLIKGFVISSTPPRNSLNSLKRTLLCRAQRASERTRFVIAPHLVGLGVVSPIIPIGKAMAQFACEEGCQLRCGHQTGDSTAGSGSHAETHRRREDQDRLRVLARPPGPG